MARIVDAHEWEDSNIDYCIARFHWMQLERQRDKILRKMEKHIRENGTEGVQKFLDDIDRLFE